MMHPISITGERNHVVCFQGEGFEAGIVCSRSSGMPYCVWQTGKRANPVVQGSTGNSWDDLLLQLVDKNPCAAHWLLCQHVSLVDPAGTVIGFIRRGIFKSICPDAPVQYGDLKYSIYLRPDVPEFQEELSALRHHCFCLDGKVTATIEEQGVTLQRLTLR